MLITKHKLTQSKQTACVGIKLTSQKNKIASENMQNVSKKNSDEIYYMFHVFVTVWNTVIYPNNVIGGISR